jgi:hypothetical protein
MLLRHDGDMLVFFLPYSHCHNRLLEAEIGTIEPELSVYFARYEESREERAGTGCFAA